MADITVTAVKVGTSNPDFAIIKNMVAAAAITAGQTVYQDSNGLADLADGSAATTAQIHGIAITGAAIGQAVAVLQYGMVEGFAITGLAYDARVYVSDTAGALADAAGTVPVTVGRVVGLTDGAVTKVLEINCLRTLTQQYT